MFSFSDLRRLQWPGSLGLRFTMHWQKDSTWLPSLGAVVERRLLVRRNHSVVAPARGLLLEVVLRRLHETGVGQQVEPGENDCLGRNNHSLLADAHPRRRRRLPRVRRT